MLSVVILVIIDVHVYCTQNVITYCIISRGTKSTDSGWAVEQMSSEVEKGV